MSRVSLVVLAAVVGALASFVFMTLMPTQNVSLEQKKETIYDRVMRENVLQCGYVVWPGGFEIDVKTGKKSGINYDIAEAWAKKIGIKINWATEVIYGQHVQDLNSGKIDAMCGCDGPLVYSTAAQLDYARPYTYYGTYVYGRKEDVGKYKSIQALNDPSIRFTTYDGDISSIMVDEDFPKAQKIGLSATSDGSLLVQNVLTHKADIVLLDSFTAKIVGDKLGYLVKLFPQQVAVMPCSFSVKKGETELLNMISQGMDLINNLGIVQKIVKKYQVEDTVLPVAKPFDE